MEKEKKLTDGLELRHLGERSLKVPAGGHSDLSTFLPKRLASLIYDLSVQQVELKTQNDALRHIQHELERTRDRYSDLFDISPVGYFTLTEKGIIDEANLTIASMFGAEKSALIGMPINL